MVSTEMIAKVLTEMHQKQGEATPARMFLQALPHLFGGEQHEYAVRMTEMLGETLKQARAAGGEQQVSLAAHLEETQASLEAKQAEFVSAENSENAAKAAVEEKTLALSEMQKVTKVEEGLHQDAKESKTEIEQARQTLETAKAEVDTVANGSMQMLFQGTWDGEEARDDFVRVVCEYLQSMGCDKVLLASLPKALGCSPADRGTFSKLAVDTAMKQLSEKSGKLQQELEAGVDSFEQASAECLGAWAIADVARDKEREAADAKASAESVFQQAVVDGKLAKNKVADVGAERKRILSEQALLDAKVQDMDTALADMLRLESEGQQVDQQNEDGDMPAAKRMKTGDADNTMHISEVPPLITAQ
jgi:hypothetical protein